LEVILGAWDRVGIRADIGAKLFIAQRSHRSAIRQDYDEAIIVKLTRPSRSNCW
jgi:hypothetical protein